MKKKEDKDNLNIYICISTDIYIKSDKNIKFIFYTLGVVIEIIWNNYLGIFI